MSHVATDRPGAGRTLFAIMLWGQGIFFLITAVWPLVDMTSFEAVTGDKTDEWLVKAVAGLITAVAVVLLLAAVRGTHTLEMAILAIGSSVALLAIDLVYVPQGVIDRIYLLDALAEGILIVGWLVTLAVRGRGR